MTVYYPILRDFWTRKPSHFSKNCNTIHVLCTFGLKTDEQIIGFIHLQKN